MFCINTETGVQGEIIHFVVFLRGDDVAGSALFHQFGEFCHRNPADISEIHLYPKENQYDPPLLPETLDEHEKKRIYTCVFDKYDLVREALEECDG